MNETYERAGAKLALSSWLPNDEPAGVLFYVHGVQSHAGWLFETGPELARRKIAVYALDRRGSGRSEGARGDVDHHRTWIEDYAGALALVRARHRDRPLAIYGQSLGGSIAAGLACAAPHAYDALLFSAPALNRHRTKRTEASVRALAAEPDQDAERTLDIDDTAYTRDERYLAFIRSDPLILRAVTKRAWVALYELEVDYMTRGAPFRDKPCALILPRADRIIDREVSRRAFVELTGGEGAVLELGAGDHYLEFSKHRAALYAFAACFVTSKGLSS